MTEEIEIPEGCISPIKKLNTDLKTDAEKNIIDKDIQNLKKCLQSNQPE